MPLPIPELPKGRRYERIAFMGKMGSGKTFCANYLEKQYGYQRVALAGKLKALANEMYGVTGKDGNDRVILQGLGTDLRKYDPDVWIKYLLNTVLRLQYVSNKERFVLDDLRYPNEAIILRNAGFTIIRVTAFDEIREGRLATLYPNRPAATALHASETEQEGIVANYEIGSNDERTLKDIDQLLTLLDFYS